MNLGNRKFWTIAAPMAVAGLILGSLWWVTSSRPGNAKKESTPTGSVTIPQNPAHEKAALEEQLKHNPDHPPILMRLAELERDAGSPAGAAAHLRKLLAKDPANADARLELGRALYDSGDIPGAMEETKRLITEHPDNVDGLYNLGAIYANQSQFEIARQYWTKAVMLAPQSDSGRKAQDSLLKLAVSALPIGK